LMEAQRREAPCRYAVDPVPSIVGQIRKRVRVNAFRETPLAGRLPLTRREGAGVVGSHCREGRAGAEFPSLDLWSSLRESITPSVESDGGAMSAKKHWRKPPPAKPRPEDRFWRRAPGGLLGWSGRVLQPDQQMQQRRPDDEHGPACGSPHAAEVRLKSRDEPSVKAGIQ